MDVTHQQDTAITCQSVLRKLKRHAHVLSKVNIKDMLMEDLDRVSDFTQKLPNLLYYFANQNVDRKALHWLKAYAQACGVNSAFERLRAGALVNSTECLPALHYLHRCASSDDADESTWPQLNAVVQAQDSFFDFVDKVINQQTKVHIKRIVHIGIGGSYLGPKLLLNALEHMSSTGIDVHFVANLDEQDFEQTIDTVDPKTTFFVIASKSWRTKETLLNLRRVQAWLASHHLHWSDHCLAVTANTARAQDMGFQTDLILPMMAWVGGRYSIWSAASVSVACAIGPEAFKKFLSGGRSVDQALLREPLIDSLPMLQALLNFWHTTICQTPVKAVLPYAYGLRNFSDFVQQLDMESLGKTHHRHAHLAELPTGTIILGGEETCAQHAYHQLLHQGCYNIPIEFVLPVAHEQKLMIAEALGQGAAYLDGMDSGSDDPKSMPGNRPSSTLLMKGLTPESLGALVATYEYQIFFSSVLWGINPFDQYGVEYGKLSATQMMDALEGRAQYDMDPSSAALIDIIQQWMDHDAKNTTTDKRDL